MRAGFLVSVRGAPRVGAEVEKRAKAEAQAALRKLLEAARDDGAGVSESLELTPVDVANRGVFVLLLTGPNGGTLDAAGSLAQAAYSSLAAAVAAGTAADDGLGFQYCDKILPIQHQLSGEPTASGISEAVQAQLRLTRPASGSSVAVLVHVRGDDAHGAAERGGSHLTTVEAREAVLQATVNAGCGVDLQSPDWAVVVTMWRASGTEAAAAGVAVVPGVSIRSKPRLAPVRLPRPKVDPATMPSKTKALKRRVQPDSGTGGGNTGAGDGKAEKKKVAAPTTLSAEDATTLLRAALVRRAELLALVRPVSLAAAACNDDASTGSGAGISGRTCDCWRLVHGTGDGFDGLTSDVLGLDGSGRLRVLVEAHHKWADPAPLIIAIRSLAEEGLLPHAVDTPSRAQTMREPHLQESDSPVQPPVAVYLKMRFLADARQSGGLLAEGSTELPVPILKRKQRKKENCKKAKIEPYQSNAAEQEPEGATSSAVDAPCSTSTHPQEAHAAAQMKSEQDEGSIVCSEEGLKFELSITRGEHIGLFLDSRTARAKVRGLAAGRRVLNLFAFTGGMGVAAAAGGAKSTTNVDNKLSFLKIAERNYDLNSFPHDSRTFVTEDAVRFMKAAVRDKWRRYNLIVLDPPPRFGRNRKQSEWEFDATKDFGKLLGLTLQLLDGPGALVLAGFPCTAGMSDEDGFEGMVEEAQNIAGCRLRCKPTVWPGVDFPFCPHRPTARFLLAEVITMDQPAIDTAGTSKTVVGM